MKTLSLIALGSGLGGGLRYGIDLLVLNVRLDGFPLSTLFVNLSGSLLVGYLAGRWATAGKAGPPSQKWHFWVIGFCGGYTTFSAFSWQVMDLVRSSHGTLAGAYAAGSLGFGLVAVYLGLMLAARRQSSGSTQQP